MQQTKLQVGIDEAGYGPRMGPLTIGATAWRVPVPFDADDMTKLLEPEFLSKPIQSQSTHVPIGDSKKIHRDKLAVEGLVLGAWFLCYAANRAVPADWDSQMAAFAFQDWNRISKVPWYVPLTSPRQSHWIERLDGLISDYPAYFGAAITKLNSHAISLAGIRMRVIDEIEFNQQISRTGNKSTLLSECSLELAREMVREFSKPGESIEIYCDKHGGRNRYQSLLTFTFDEAWFEIEMEGRECSRYSALWRDRSVRIQFKVDGDSIFPSASASILAKWTRESLMERFNGFWQANVQGGIASTAGYYVDALRFAEQIETTAMRLGLHRDKWWRKK